jgi:hypothetical protein
MGINPATFSVRDDAIAAREFGDFVAQLGVLAVQLDFCPTDKISPRSSANQE